MLEIWRHYKVSLYTQMTRSLLNRFQVLVKLGYRVHNRHLFEYIVLMAVHHPAATALSFRPSA